MQKSKTMQSSSRILIYLCILLLGIILGKVIISWPLLKMDYTISLVDLFSIISTVILALLISYYFEKQKQKSEKEKELVLNRLSDINDLIDNLLTRLEDGFMPIQDATSKVKRINLIFLNILDIIKKTDVNLDETISDSFFEKNKELRDLLTKTPQIVDWEEVSGILQEDISVANDKLVFSEPRVAEIETHLEKMKGDLVEIQLFISVR